MPPSEIPTSSILFSLYPCNDEARQIVRENEAYLDSMQDVDCISVEIRHKSKQDGKLLSLGYGLSSNDIILSDTRYGGQQCFFTYSPDGELIVQDDSPNESTELCWYGEEGLMTKYTFKGYPRRRTLPLTIPQRIKLKLANKAVFYFVWRIDLTAKKASSVRKTLVEMYQLRYWENKMMLDFPSADLAEEYCRNTPSVPRAFQRKNFIDTFSYGKVGSGGFGKVYKVVDLAVGKILAMKVARASRDTGRSKKEKWKRTYRVEVERLASLQHEHVVRFVHSQGWTEGKPVQIFFEFYHGDARNYFHNDKHSCTAVIPSHDRISIDLAYLIDHILKALDFLHTRGYIHRDVKPENILFKTQPGYKKRPFFVLSDFGFVTKIAEAKGAYGSTCYMAPETTRYGQHTPVSDIYAFGVSLLEMMDIVCPSAREEDVRVWRGKLVANKVEDGHTYRDKKEKGPLVCPKMELSHSRIRSLLDHGLVDLSFRSLLDMNPSRRSNALVARQSLVHGEVTESKIIFSKRSAYDEVLFGVGKQKDLWHPAQQQGGYSTSGGAQYYNTMPQYITMPMPQFSGPLPYSQLFPLPLPSQYATSTMPHQFITSSSLARQRGPLPTPGSEDYSPNQYTNAR